MATATGSAKDIRLPLLIVSLASALGPFSNLIYAPNLVAVRETFQTTTTLAGASVSVFGLVLALSQLVAGPLADRFSGRRQLIGGLALYTAASLLAYFAPTIEVFLVARALQAAGAATGLVVGGAMIADQIPPAQRGRAMGTLQMFNAIGGSTGPLVGSLAVLLATWQASSLVLLLAGLGLTFAALLYLPQISAPSARLTLRGTLAVLRFPPTATVLFVGFVQWFGQFALIAYLPVVLRQHVGLPDAWSGVFLLPVPLGVLIGAPLGGRLVDRYGARRLLFVGAWMTAIFTALFALSLLLDLELLALLLITPCTLGYAVGLGISVPPQLALMVEGFAQQRGAAVGTYAALRYFGGACGPLVVGFAIEQLGLASGFLVAPAAMAVGALTAHLVFSRRRYRIHADHHPPAPGEHAARSH